ncbi:MAG: hypothetical protein KY453_03045 [Gemmatimonadetes bacterium]|nr:hypothetical protein [Gemmatimonadota bacterium]
MTGRRSLRTTICLGASLLLGALAAPAAGQQRDSIPGVSLGLVVQGGTAPALAIKPFTGRFGGDAAASQVEAIMGRDLRYSDRFEIMDSMPAAIMGEGVDYRLWDRLGATWLLTGQVEGAGDAYLLVLELHDIPYGQVRERGRFRVPNPDHPDFRMAVHRASDALVEWVFDEPGMAASRIAFSMRSPAGVKELYVIDSDGEGLRKLTNHDAITMSPAWSPDGQRMAFMSYKTGFPRIFVHELATRREQEVEAGQPGDYYTPAWAPDGETLTFSVQAGGSRTGLFSYNALRNCCVEQLTGGRWNDISPTYSPDGRFIAFNSNRLGTAVPQIYVMPARGGDPELLSPYEYGNSGYFTSPDWSPTGDMVAFHGRIRRGQYHILVARPGERGRIRQLTWEGNNEDPSWAPDGRHMVFKGERGWGKGLFVVDVATGRIRTLLPGVDVTVPDWSPSLPGDGS